METSSTNKPFYVRFFRWLFSWRMLRRFLISAVGLITLIALFFTEENWRANRDWKKYKAQLEAKGEKLDWAAFVPPPVPDEQNFALSPFFQNLDLQWHSADPVRATEEEAIRRSLSPSLSSGTNQPPALKHNLVDLEAWQEFYRGNTNYPNSSRPQSAAEDVLLALSKFDPVLKELREAAATRPFSRFPGHYEKNIGMLVPHLAILKSPVTALHLRVAANLELGHVDEAFEDVKLSFHLAESIKDEPLLISYLVRISLQTITLYEINEGLVRHRWKPEHLEFFETQLRGINMLADFKQNLRGERAMAIGALDMLRSGGIPREAVGAGSLEQATLMMPHGVLLQNQIAIVRAHEELLLPAVDESKGVISLEKSARIESELHKGSKLNPYKLFARMLVPAISRASERAARIQNLFNEAIIACALEKYHRAYGTFPEKLEELVPQFAKELPHDVINGEPLRYWRTTDGKFVLYSVAWDGQDDGGTPATRKKDFETGDWVWNQPGKQ